MSEQVKSWLENGQIVRNLLLLLVVSGTLFLGGIVLLYGIVSGSLVYSGSIDGGILVGAVVIGASVASARFLFGNPDGNKTTEVTTETTTTRPPE